jgi:hypothetical protein
VRRFQIIIRDEEHRDHTTAPLIIGTVERADDGSPLNIDLKGVETALRDLAFRDVLAVLFLCTSTTQAIRDLTGR